MGEKITLWQRWETSVQSESKNFKRCDHVVDIDIDGGVILKFGFVYGQRSLM
jgi:hypothetical protein